MQDNFTAGTYQTKPNAGDRCGGIVPHEPRGRMLRRDHNQRGKMTRDHNPRGRMLRLDHTPLLNTVAGSQPMRERDAAGHYSNAGECFGGIIIHAGKCCSRIILHAEERCRGELLTHSIAPYNFTTYQILHPLHELL